MKIYNDIEQQSLEWFEIRKLKLTASHAQRIGNNGKGLDTYVTELVAESLSSGDKQRFGNFHTDRGNELEEYAAEVYEMETGNKTEKVGFIEYSEFVGCSPDRLVGEEGGSEIKAPDDVKYYKLIVFGEQEIESSYKWQVQMNLFITGRKWWDLSFYNPNFKKNILIFRIFPNLEMQESLRKGIDTGVRLIKEQLALYEEKIKETGPKIIGQEPKEDLVLVYEGNKQTTSFTLPKMAVGKKRGNKLT